MTLRLNSTGGGFVEIDAPNTASNFSLTAPIANGTLDTTGRAGNILQVVQNYVTTTSSTSVTGGTMANLPVSTSITPTSSSSKVLVRVRWTGEFTGTSQHNSVFRLLRGGTVIGNPPTAGSRVIGISGISMGFWNADADSTMDNTWFEYLDSPNTTSSITYQLATIFSVTGTVHTNRTVTDTDDSDRERLTSSITLIEVAA